LSPPNTPFLLPVPIIYDALVIRQLLHFRIKIASNIVFYRLQVTNMDSVKCTKAPHPT